MAEPETFFYGPHELQKIHVYKIQDTPSDKSLIWVIYIHGGAWRDNTVLANSFSQTQAILQSDPMIQNHVAGFASIDYRLSPHPNSPQDPSTTPESQLRAAVHPDHFHDVLNALRFLQDKYSFKDQYILVGHSCGATLSFQLVMNKVQGANSTPVSIPKPLAVAGVCGIYDLQLLRQDFKSIKIYEDFIKGAFGSDEELWDGVSPAKVTDPDGVAVGWHNGQVAVLATSTGDTLINQGQTDAMREPLEQWKGYGQGREVIELYNLREEHDDVWGKGEELARVISVTLQSLIKRKPVL